MTTISGDFQSFVLEDEVKKAYLKLFTTQFDADVWWQFVGGIMIFIMHLGFAMLETGSMPDKHKVNILFKNLVTVLIGNLSYFIIGFGFNYGSAKNNSFLGGDRFFGSEFTQSLEGGQAIRSDYFIHYAFAITSATIVSGAVVGRMKLEAYFIITIVMTAVVFPIVSHWAWSDTGFLSAFKGGNVTDLSKYLFNEQYPNACGVIDFAGSGVVHVTGGLAALLSAYFVGPRTGRFNEDGSINAMPGHNLSIATLGTFVLWFGWFGFNAGSTLEFNGPVAARVTVTTALAPSTAFITFMSLQKFRTGKYDLPGALNAILSGLVAVTAGCAVIQEFAAIPIGFVGAIVYIHASELLNRKQIDDPIGAAAVHFFNGVWGVIAAGIFGTPANHAQAYDCPVPLEISPNADYLEPLPGYQMLQQLMLLVLIILWTAAIFTPVLYILRKQQVLRVSPEQEKVGLDRTEHGVQDYTESGIYGDVHQRTDAMAANNSSFMESKPATPSVHFINNL